jgi:hypothetical protein
MRVWLRRNMVRAVINCVTNRGAMRAVAPALVAAFGLHLDACSSVQDQGTVMVVLQTELRAGTDVNAVAVFVTDPAGKLYSAQLTQVIAQDAVEARGAASAASLPATLAISAVATDAATPIVVKLVAFRSVPGIPDAAIPIMVREVAASIPSAGIVALPIALTYANVGTANGPSISISGSTAGTGGRVSFDSFNYAAHTVKPSVCEPRLPALAEDGTCAAVVPTSPSRAVDYDEASVFGGGKPSGENAACFKLTPTCVSQATPVVLPRALAAGETDIVEVPYPANVSSMAGRTLLLKLKGTAELGECDPKFAAGSCIVALAGPGPKDSASGETARKFGYSTDDAKRLILLRAPLARRLAGELETLLVAPTCCGARTWVVPSCSALFSLAKPTNTCQ